MGINVNYKEVSDKNKSPIIVRYSGGNPDYNDLIVLITDWKNDKKDFAGIVISPSKNHPLGDNTQDWWKDNFKPFYGKIEIVVD